MGNLRRNKCLNFQKQLAVKLLVSSLFALQLFVPSSYSLESSRVKRQSDDGDAAGGVELSSLSSLARGVRCRGMRVMDEKTLEIDELDYDGEGPAAWFMVGNNPNYADEFVDLGGTIIPDENGSCDLLKEYNQKDVRLVLPGDMKWSDMNYLSIFCLRFNHNFGSVFIPDNMKLANGSGKGTNLEECNQDPEEAENTGPPRRVQRPSRPAGPPSGGSSGGGSSGILGGLIDRLIGK